MLEAGGWTTGGTSGKAAAVKLSMANGVGSASECAMGTV